MQENITIVFCKDHSICSVVNRLELTPQWSSTKCGKIKDTAVARAMGVGCLQEGRSSMEKVYGAQKYTK